MKKFNVRVEIAYPHPHHGFVEYDIVEAPTDVDAVEIAMRDLVSVKNVDPTVILGITCDPITFH